MSGEGSLVGWLDRLRSWQLVVLAGGLLLADLFVLDPIPFVDEVMLGLTTLLFARWKRRRD